MSYSIYMDKSLFECFTSALYEVFSETGIEVDNIKETHLPRAEDIQIVTSIGLTGSIKGTFLMLMDLESATNIADTMMKSMNLSDKSDKFDALKEAAIAEITNQISGHALTNLFKKHIQCDMTPPTILVGEKIKLMTSNLVNLVTKITTGSFGRLYILMGIKN